MRTEIFSNPSSFLGRTENYFRGNEVRYSLIYSLSERLKEDLYFYGKENPWFMTVSEGNILCCACLRTPPYNLIVSYFNGETEKIAQFLCNTLNSEFGSIPGVVGDVELAKPFADKYCASNNIKIKRVMNQRIYKLEKVNDIELPDGIFRIASESDKELLDEWRNAFAFEALGKEKAELGSESKIKAGSIFIWETDEPVSMALKCRPLLNGVSIGEVYTPEKFRNKGYATACVISLCRLILDSGYKYCTLYTDLANPASNSIYKKMGFFPVCDSIQIDFRQ